MVDFETEKICLNQIINQKKDNFCAEENIIIPDVKPDILSTIDSSGNVYIYKKEIVNGRLKIDGGVYTYVIYIADNEQNDIRGLHTVIDFSQSIEIEKLTQDMDFDCDLNIRNIECKILNGRKINIKINLEANIKVFSNNEKEFVKSINDTQKIWADFLNTGILKEPSTEDVPGDFICDDEIYRKLKGTIKSINCKNWYAYYQMGIYEFWKGEIETARLHFEESLNRKKSPWAYHGLGCCNILDKQYDLAIECIVKGLATRKDDLSYVKESFRLLLKAEGYQALLEQYADLSDQFKAESRIYFDYLEAMSHTGEANKVYEILKSNDTYELVDLREGDSSIERLWVELETTLFGRCRSIPDKYNYSSITKEVFS